MKVRSLTNIGDTSTRDIQMSRALVKGVGESQGGRERKKKQKNIIQTMAATACNQAEKFILRSGEDSKTKHYVGKV